MDADFGNKDDIIRQKDFYWMLWKRIYIRICSQKLEYAELKLFELYSIKD